MQQFSASRGFGLSFVHPRAWQEYRYDISGSFSDLIVFLSNTRVPDPCIRTASSIDCSDPIKKLEAGQILVSWSNYGYLHTGPEIPHANTTISGEPARVTLERPGNCGIGAQETITADIARPQGNHYEMKACLRGPNLARDEALVGSMLHSVRVTG